MSTPMSKAGAANTAEATAAVGALVRGDAVAVGGWDLALEGGPGERGLAGAAWVVKGVDDLVARSGAVPGAVRRLMRKLTPGPLVVRFAPADAAKVPQAALGADGLVAVASPEGRGLGEVVEAVRQREPDRAVLGLERAGAGAPATVVSVARTPMGIRATVERAGTYEERFVRKQLERTILFVCTGNTCRSPMAEAIATALIERRGESGTLHAASAGTSATSGEPVSREVAAALESVGVAWTGGRGGARGLTARMVEEADVVYAMTRAHRQAALVFAGRGADKVQVLDPRGGDVPDPIGQGAEVYSATARRLMELIAARLEELDA